MADGSPARKPSRSNALAALVRPSSSRHVSSYGWVAVRHVARPSLQTEPRRHAHQWRSPPARAGKDQSAGRAPAACSNCCKVTALGATSCARAASGHTAAPPRRVMNSRRFRSSIQLAPQGPPRKNCASLRSNSNGFGHARPFFDLALDEFLEILGGPAVGGTSA